MVRPFVLPQAIALLNDGSAPIHHGSERIEDQRFRHDLRVYLRPQRRGETRKDDGRGAGSSEKFAAIDGGAHAVSSRVSIHELEWEVATASLDIFAAIARGRARARFLGARPGRQSRDTFGDARQERDSGVLSRR